MSLVREATTEEIRYLRAIINHQLGVDVGDVLFKEGVKLKISKNTGKIREVLDSSGRRLASVRASSYTFNLTLLAARVIHEVVRPPRLRVVVVDEIAPDIAKSSTLFARHVLSIDENLRAGDEVLVVDEKDNLLCVGRLVLSPLEVLHFIRGPAVKLRECSGG
ncbi:MAG: tRNA-guanine transglycosylase [Desulfurococcales archaeon]|nr:tRNA-guanine transglycosylase [Desulfurococcales archaeon]